MARLPQPGGDNGNWGNILNEYLSQALKSDGKIKDNAVTSNTIAPNSITNAAIASDAITAASIADGAIQESKLDVGVQAKLNVIMPDADATTKGKLRLAGDLGGTATNPQVAKIQGIAISGSPSSGQVLMASSGTAASWTTPASLPNLSSGSIPFSNGTTFSQDNSNFFWDNTNKRLGIGTNAPSSAVHIAGTSYASSQVQTDIMSDVANSILSMRRARTGMIAIQTGDVIGSLAWKGYDGSSYGSDAASINVAAVSNFTTSNHGTVMGFSVTPVGSTTGITPMVLYGDHLDLKYDIASPTNVQSGIYSAISGKGDNASYTGVTAGHFQARDRDDVDASNKGVLIGLIASVMPRIVRNNVPYDDVNGIMVSNDGSGKGTDAIYIAKHDSFAGQSEWMTTFTSDADADFGIRMMGNYAVQMLNLKDKFVVDGNGALFMASHSEPTTPSGGGVLYVESGNLKFKESTGTVTTLANDGHIGSPKIDTIKDINGNPSLSLATSFTNGITDGLVNYFANFNNAPGGPPTLAANGPDTNISITLATKGNGLLTLYSPSDTPTIFGAGPSANQDLNLKPNGNGKVKINGVEAVTTSDAQTLSNKTLSNTVTAANFADAATVNAGKLIVKDPINTHPESPGFVPIPNLFNDIAFNNLRGGSVTVTKNGTTLTPGTDYFNPDNMFANAGFALFPSPAISDTYVITVTLCQPFTYGTYWGIQMGDAWMAQDVTMELFYSGTWHTIYSTTNNTGYGLHWIQNGASQGNPVTKIRYTLTNNLQLGSLRITSLFAIAYDSPLATAGFLPRSGGSLYGTNAAPPTLTAAGSDANINLNLQSQGAGKVQANGVDVVTTTAAQTLTNKTLTTPVINGLPTGTGVASTATASTLAFRDAQANISADAFIPGFTTTVTAAGTTTLTADSTELQIFTGTNIQTIVMPTTGIVAGQRFTIINQSNTGSITVNASGGANITAVGFGASMTIVALVATPTTGNNWIAVSASINGSAPTISSSALTPVRRDTNADINANSFIPGMTTTATAAGTTTLTAASAETQYFTGTQAQTVTLPTSSIVAGQRFTIINDSTGNVTLNASGGGLVANVQGFGWAATVVAKVATPTTAANWALVSLLSTSSGFFDKTATNNTIVQRTSGGNVAANAFWSNLTSTATAAGTTTLTITSSEIQVFTGSTTQTVVLPTTSTLAGQRYTIINQSTGAITINASGGGTVISALNTGYAVTLTALIATPAATTDWGFQLSLNIGASTGTGGSTLAQRNSGGSLNALAFIPIGASTATAAGTTTLTTASGEVQIFTGTTTQTVVLPTTSVIMGQRYTIVNNSSGTVTLNSSGGNLVASLQASSSVVVTALQATPTTAAHWSAPVSSSLATNQGAVASTVAQRDAQANLLADAFVPGFTTTVTAAGTTVLTVDSTEVQEFTGTNTQIITLPTTGVVAGQRYTVINNSSNGITVQSSNATTLVVINGNAKLVTFTAVISTPTTAAHWVIGFLPTNNIFQGGANGTSIPQRDAFANLSSNSFIPGYTTTVTAAGTTTLTVASTEIQVFTGSTTQTVTLPTTSIVAGQRYTIMNNSTGLVTINASGGGNVAVLGGGIGCILTALQATPTTAAHWSITYAPSFPITVSATVNTIARRDSQANLLADAFVPGFTTTVTAAGTTTLTVDSTEVQEFTGSTTQTVTLPTTSIAAGQRYTIIANSTGNITINASGGGQITGITGATIVVTALVATPTLTTHWSSSVTQGYTSTAASVQASLVRRDSNANAFADAFVPGFTSTVTAAGTTTMTVDSTEVQYFSGTTTQTVVLPTTSIAAGQRYTFINNSTGTVTVNSSGGNLVASLQGSTSIVVTSLQATPTTATHWSVFVSNSYTANQSAVASSIAQRDAQANLVADAFIPGFTSTVTAAGTTTLTSDSMEVQEFTGSSNQTVTLPTTGVVAGQRYTVINSTASQVITVNASGGAQIATANGNNRVSHFIALVANPTTAAHWQYFLGIGVPIAQSAGSSSLIQRDANANAFATNFIPTLQTLATAGGTTTFAVNTAGTVLFTGTSTQTVSLPTTGVAAGAEWKIINTSTGALTINSSGGNLVKTLAAGAFTFVTALVATPTTAANWYATA
ncbi:MAG: hypothetical protein JWN75_384 [Candidatus Saccharibacteria bacterium]|nr:hypothetical protein [Candidatus Saccharibacteria bacterium]